MKKIIIFLFLLAFISTAPIEAKAELHNQSRGNPFHLLGHVLAPVGNLYGYVIVEPVFFVFDKIKPIFQLD